MGPDLDQTLELLSSPQQDRRTCRAIKSTVYTSCLEVNDCKVFPLTHILPFDRLDLCLRLGCDFGLSDLRERGSHAHTHQCKDNEQLDLSHDILLSKSDQDHPDLCISSFKREPIRKVLK